MRSGYSVEEGGGVAGFVPGEGGSVGAMMAVGDYEMSAVLVRSEVKYRGGKSSDRSCGPWRNVGSSKIHESIPLHISLQMDCSTRLSTSFSTENSR